MTGADMDLSGRSLVIFDLDGTLADTLPGISATARTVLMAHGFAEEDLGDLSRLVGPAFPGAFSLVYGVSAEEAESITADYRKIYNSIGPSAWPLFDGILDLLHDLRAAGKRLAIASSKQQRMVCKVCEDNGMADCFDAICSKQRDHGDPKEVLVKRTLDTFGLAAADAVMVGDRLYDVNAANANDVPCVGVLYGRTAPRSELEDAGAAAIADTVDDLRRILLG